MKATFDFCTLLLAFKTGLFNTASSRTCCVMNYIGDNGGN